jgi:uncharacterized membrane protein YdjX (TVP38/TMEM64 family)
MNWQKLQRLAFVTFLILIVVLFVLFKIFGHDTDLEGLRWYIKDFGIWAPLIFIVLYILGTFFIPSTPFMLAAGILFGFKYGLLYTAIGSLLSAATVFYISRKLGKDWVEKILEHRYLKHLHEYNKRLETGAIWDIILLRVTPIMPFNALNILLGVSRVKMRDYIIGTAFGLLPTSILTVYLGVFVTKIF